MNSQHGTIGSSQAARLTGYTHLPTILLECLLTDLLLLLLDPLAIYTWDALHPISFPNPFSHQLA